VASTRTTEISSARRKEFRSGARYTYLYILALDKGFGRVSFGIEEGAMGLSCGGLVMVQENSGSMVSDS
jgi:hypothetical protein